MLRWLRRRRALALTASKDWITRNNGIYRLEQLDDDASWNAIVRLLGDRDEHVRCCAAKALIRTSVHSNPALKSKAIQVLFDSAVADLKLVGHGPAHHIPQFVELGLEAVPHMVSLLLKDWYRHETIVPTLEELKAADGLVQCLAVTSATTRSRVGAALARLGDIRCIPSLLELLANDTDEVSQREAAESLGLFTRDMSGEVAGPLRDYERKKRLRDEKRAEEARQTKLRWEEEDRIAKESEARVQRELQATVKKWSDRQMVAKLVLAAEYYARGGMSRDNPALVREVLCIGGELNRRGGIVEMRRVFSMVPPMQGKRTVEGEWDGIGEWRG